MREKKLICLKVQIQIEKALVNDCLHVSKTSWKFRIPTIYHFGVIYPWNLLFSKKLAYFLTVSIVFFLFINKILRINNSKTRTAMIIYFLLYNLHDCTFNDSFFVLRNWLYVFYKFHSKWRKNALVEIAFMSLIKCAPFVNIYIYLFFLGLNLVSNILTNDISESRCDAQLRKWLFSSAH